MNGHIRSLIAVMVFTGLFVGGCAKATTPVPTETPVPTATLTSTPSPAPTIQPGDSERTLKTGDLNQSYIIHIPPGVDMVQPIPVVFVFHGGTVQAEEMENLGFNEISDNYGFLVVYPTGYGLSWNAGGCCGLAVDKNIDDIAFVRQMLSDLGTIVRIDPKRIYATGWSNGALFAYRLGCEMSDTFAAIAPVSGYLLTNPCQPQQPVSVIHEHGLKDDYDGFTEPIMINGVNTDIIFPPVEQGIATWVQIDGCNNAPNISKEGVVTHTVYSGCRAGTAVELYTIDVQGHSWPSAYVLPFTKIAWEFFAAHPKP